MKFGNLEQQELAGVDWILPPDHEATARVLGGIKAKKPVVYTGCGKWGIKEWVGPLYPLGTKEKDYLKFYKEQFDSIELNNTFYRLSRTAIDSWIETVKGTDFKFCPKWSRRVSHLKRLNDVEENTQYFIDSCTPMGKHLGTSFLQMPENFGPKWFDRLADWLKNIPKGFPLQIELRNKEWFEDPIFTKTWDLFEEHGVGGVITDVGGRRDILHMRLTTKTAFIRFNGYLLHESDYTRLDDWADRIAHWVSQGIEEVYFFSHQGDEALTPQTSSIFVEKLKARGEFEVKGPTLNKSNP